MSERWPRATLDAIFEQAKLKGVMFARAQSLEDAISLRWALQHRRKAHPESFTVLLDKEKALVTVRRKIEPTVELLSEPK